MRKINRYVVWDEPFNWCTWAFAQGYAESEEEFREICKANGIIIGNREVECSKMDVKGLGGRELRKGAWLEPFH